MIRFYRLYGEAPALGAELPEDLAGTGLQRYRMAAGELVVLTFQEGEFALIPPARRWLRGHPSATITELGDRLHDAEDSRSAPLVRLTGGELEDREPLEAGVYQDAPCPACGLAAPRLAAQPRLRLPYPLGSDLGWLGGPRVWVASPRFVDALRAAGLDSGLATFPVEVDGEAPGALLGLYSTASLGMPAAPYGFTGEACAVCGRASVRRPGPEGVRVDAGRPRYAFYPTFAPPDGAADWGWSELSTETDLYVSHRVHAWLEGPGARYAAAGSEVRGEIYFIAAGRYPDEWQSAFLSPQYHE
jgi:hypothetical protein